MTKNKFEHYIEDAITECKKMSFEEKGRGIWDDPTIIDYFSRLPPDEPIKTTAELAIESLSGKQNTEILIIGGGSGRLGRCLIDLDIGLNVTEVDSSPVMSRQANHLSKELGIQDRFVSQVSQAQSLPFQNKQFDLVITYAFFRYIDSKDQTFIIAEMSRVSNNRMIIAEPTLKDLIGSLSKKTPAPNEEIKIKEQSVSAFRTSLFYMLYRRYKRDRTFRSLINIETSTTKDHIDVMTDIAGTTTIPLYFLITL